jgi:hypothetical protein
MDPLIGETSSLEAMKSMREGEDEFQGCALCEGDHPQGGDGAHI